MTIYLVTVRHHCCGDEVVGLLSTKERAEEMISGFGEGDRWMFDIKEARVDGWREMTQDSEYGVADRLVEVAKEMGI